MTGTPDALAPLPCPTGTDPQQVADTITARARSSFSAGMRLLARPRRDAMRALYAFARVLDDIADGGGGEAEKRRLLDAWREEVGRIERGAPVSAIGRALAEPMARYRLPAGELLLLIEGMETDAGGGLVAPPLQELRAYTRQVAGTIGLLSMRIFGAWQGPESERAALALGDAFQLTNILRDVAEDARRGRVYLPAEALAAAGIGSRVPAEIACHPGLPQARTWLGQLARTDFVTARAAMAMHPRRHIAPALMMTGVYEGYLSDMAAAGFGADASARVSPARKLWRGLRCLAGPVAPGSDG